ncbi:JDVT-CTERM system glutamic-type intramembrane protease MrtJ [Granulosicoccus antarcticus]|uniref:CAAX prenyl protease 2/Lysostaphin resistance protein A-like domain-containing protein n=1 Tax=Granulosicoccus antarcticus IMCC3135 TaxID=1192854 RepID=A0A2Z2NRR2_9GAMM|nr:JDVT-CTERM system glutamic-type intramembrane protease [Granulosicoccus antarcticus]ASJ71430.1 hypothetical protein IMCC3135_06615 [Granulosicoccus antarcticus IMCC3135]
MTRKHRFWLDRYFWLAAVAAPLCWLLLTQLDVPLRQTALPLMTLLQIVIVSPVLEEIVFRGGLQAWLLTRISMRHTWLQISLANVLASSVFAAMHLLNQPPLWAALVILPSLVFGWAWERHQTLLSPIALHILYNAGFIWLFG